MFGEGSMKANYNLKVLLDCVRPGLEALVKLEFCSAFGKLFLYGCGWSRGMREHARGRLVIAYSCP